MSSAFAAGHRPNGRAPHVSGRCLELENSGSVKLLAARQAEFAAALRDPECPVPTGLLGPDGRPSSKRFNVYRNNVVASLTRVLRDAFPATCRIVGEEFFGAMARIYIAHELPCSPMLFDYGAGLPDFIAGFEPVEQIPYLRDVARIERAWIEAYHAAEARPIEPSAFAQINPDDLPNLCVTLHPSLRLLRSQFPALTIWQMNIEGGALASVDLAAGGQDILVVRPQGEVESRALPQGGAYFLGALREGCSMLEATEIAMTASHRFDLSANLIALMAARAFVGVTRRPSGFSGE